MENHKNRTSEKCNNKYCKLVGNTYLWLGAVNVSLFIKGVFDKNEKGLFINHTHNQNTH